MLSISTKFIHSNTWTGIQFKTGRDSVAKLTHEADHHGRGAYHRENCVTAPTEADHTYLLGCRSSFHWDIANRYKYLYPQKVHTRMFKTT